MDNQDGYHMVAPTVMSCNKRAVFSVCGWCRRFITDVACRLLGLGMWRLEDLRSSKGTVACPEELVCDFTCAVVQ
jgi:hypothetical protein